MGTTEELFFANHDVGIPPTYTKTKKQEITSTDHTTNNNMHDYKQNSPHQFVKNWNTPMLFFKEKRIIEYQWDRV